MDLFEQSLTTFRQYGARSEAAVVMYKLALLFYQTDDANRARALLPQTLAEFRALRIPGVERVEFLAQRLGVG